MAYEVIMIYHLHMSLLLSFFRAFTHYPAGYNAPEEVWRSLLPLVNKIMSCSFNNFVPVFSIIVLAFAVCIPKKIHRISVFLFRAFTQESVLGAEATFKPDSPLFESRIFHLHTIFYSVSSTPSELLNLHQYTYYEYSISIHIYLLSASGKLEIPVSSAIHFW